MSKPKYYIDAEARLRVSDRVSFKMLRAPREVILLAIDMWKFAIANVGEIKGPILTNVDPMCISFMGDQRDCTECPVSLYTGKAFCRGTSLSLFEQNCGGEDNQVAVKAAKEMIGMLSLLLTGEQDRIIFAVWNG